jgi:amidase
MAMSAGAHVGEVKVGITRPQKELSDLWCRLIMPLNVQTFEIFKRTGLDLLKDHRDDFPPGYLRSIDVGYQMSALDLVQGPGDPLRDL